MKQGKGSQSFAKRMHWSQQTPSSNNTREDSTHGHHQMVNPEIRLIIFFAAKVGEALSDQISRSAKTRLGADCGSDHEFLISKLRLKMKKVGNTTSPLRYDLNQIPYDYTVKQGKDNRVLLRKCTGHNKHPLPTTQEKTLYMDITRWSTPKSD